MTSACPCSQKHQLSMPCAGRPLFQLIDRPPIPPLDPPHPASTAEQADTFLPPYSPLAFLVHLDLPAPTEQLIRKMTIKDDPRPGDPPQERDTDGLLVDEEDVESLERGERVHRGSGRREEEGEQEEEGEEEGAKNGEDYSEGKLRVEAHRKGRAEDVNSEST